MPGECGSISRQSAIFSATVPRSSRSFASSSSVEGPPPDAAVAAAPPLALLAEGCIPVGGGVKTGAIESSTGGKWAPSRCSCA